MTEKEEKLTPQELAVKRYLDEQSENDDCLRSFYIPSKIKVGQFYANELDRDNCLPTDEVRAVMNKWLEMKEAA